MASDTPTQPKATHPSPRFWQKETIESLEEALKAARAGRSEDTVKWTNVAESEARKWMAGDRALNGI